MIILGIDSSATAASAAVVKDGKLVSEVFSQTGLTHSQTLLPMIDSCLKMAGVTVNNIDLVSVANGPGSFTGVRIGIATVKGIAFTKDIPCVEVSTLESMAYNLPYFDGIICSAMDARCNQVYTAMFRNDNNCKVDRLTDDEAMSIDQLCENIKITNEKVIFIGDGAELCYNKAKDSCENVYLAPQHIRMQRAASVAVCAIDKEQKHSKNVSVNYIRLPQAQRELAKKQLK